MVIKRNYTIYFLLLISLLFLILQVSEGIAATARVEIDHTYRGDLVVIVGVGNVNSPSWSTTVSNRAGGSADNLYVDVDISAGAAYLPPNGTNVWFLKVSDQAAQDTGTIKTFRITNEGQTYSSTDPPVAINDNQTSYAYIGGAAPSAIARVEIDHTYRGDLVVVVGVGNVNSPSWSTTVSNRAGGSADNLYVDVDISAGAAYLPPNGTNVWFLKVSDQAAQDTGTIKTFRITNEGQTYSSTDPPVAINDNQTSYAYIGGIAPPPPPISTARVEIDHTYRGDLVVAVGVGNVNSPSWSTTVSNRAGGSADNLSVDVDISGGAAYLPPGSDVWFLKVADQAVGDTGTIRTFRVTHGGQTYSSTDPPVAVKDNQTSYAYIGPKAVIDSIDPNPAVAGEPMTFRGHGESSDGAAITGYIWRSSVDGELSTSSSVSTNTLSEGTHIIYFKVKDDRGTWSNEVSKTLNVVVQGLNVEHIYTILMFNSKKSDFVSVLQNIGASLEGDIWKYVNSGQNKTYLIHIIEDMESAKQALYTENSHIIMTGHSNYGAGGVFATPEETAINEIDDIFFIDDVRIWNYSSPWFQVSIKGMITGQAYPNWWPIFRDGTSGIMPYDFGDPRGDPAYNYYITYQVSGDSTNYKVESVHNSARERFPDSGRPAWYSPDGTTHPSPTNPSHLQYYITNPNASVDPDKVCGDRVCPPVHYGSKTILFRKDLEVDLNRLKYRRILVDSCQVGTYYLDTFHRGFMFYTALSSNATGTFKYLQAYLEGKSNEEIWELMQTAQPVYDYYDFNKRPSEQ